MPSATISRPWGHGLGAATGTAEAVLAYVADASVEVSDGGNGWGSVDDG